MSVNGTKRAKAYATACPLLAKADIRALTRDFGFDPNPTSRVQPHILDLAAPTVKKGWSERDGQYNRPR